MPDTENMKIQNWYGKCRIIFFAGNQAYDLTEPCEVWRECARCLWTTTARAQVILRWVFENYGKYGKYGKFFPKIILRLETLSLHERSAGGWDRGQRFESGRGANGFRILYVGRKHIADIDYGIPSSGGRG